MAKHCVKFVVVICVYVYTRHHMCVCVYTHHHPPVVQVRPGQHHGSYSRSVDGAGAGHESHVLVVWVRHSGV